MTQVGHVVVVDNSELAPLAQDMFGPDNVELVHNGGNQGIAHALNRGVAHAVARGMSWALTMDQDSLLPPDYVASLTELLNAEPALEKTASVAGAFHDSDGTFNTVAARSGRQVDYLITSANLVRISAIQEVGGFRDDFFIDYVDYDISFKLRRAGWRVLQYPEVSYNHRIGESETKTVLAAGFRVSNHSAFRRYYIARNRIVFAREIFHENPRFAMMDLFRLFKEQIKIVLGEDDKLRKLKASYLGAVDGLSNRLGKTSRSL